MLRQDSFFDLIGYHVLRCRRGLDFINFCFTTKRNQSCQPCLNDSEGMQTLVDLAVKLPSWDRTTTVIM